MAATRELFDENGVREANIDDIARAVGVNRAIVYRHFTGKEDLFALTMVGYLDELAELLDAASGGADDPGVAADRDRHDVRRLRPRAPGLRRLRPGADAAAGQRAARRGLRAGAVSSSGGGMASCLRSLSDAIEDGVAAGDFRVKDADPARQHALRQRPRRPAARPVRARHPRVRAGRAGGRRRSAPSQVKQLPWSRPQLAAARRTDRLALQDRDDALAAGGADRDQRPARPLLGEQLGGDVDDPAAGRGERVPGGQRRAVRR